MEIADARAVQDEKVEPALPNASLERLGPGGEWRQVAARSGVARSGGQRHAAETTTRPGRLSNGGAGQQLGETIADVRPAWGERGPLRGPPSTRSGAPRSRRGR